MNIPCRVSVEERNHDLAQYGAEDENRRINEIATQAASELITNGKQLAGLVYDYELPVFGQLARALKELGNATKGDPIARDACLNALSQIEKLVLPKAVELCRDEAERRVRGEEDETN